MQRYQHAVLVDKFGLRPWEIARLSERYIREVYFHPRDEHGSLIVPSKPVNAAEFGTRYDPPASLEDELKTLRDLQRALLGTKGEGKGLQNFAAIEKAVRAKWADGSRQKVYDKWKLDKAKHGERTSTAGPAAGEHPTGAPAAARPVGRKAGKRSKPSSNS